MVPGLWAWHWGSPFSKGEKGPWGKCSRAHWEGCKLGVRGSRGNSEPSLGEVWEGIAILEGQGASRGLEGPIAFRGAGNTAAHTNLYDDEADCWGNRRQWGKSIPKMRNT